MTSPFERGLSKKYWGLFFSLIIWFILPLVLFFPLFQLGQNTQWGSSAYLSPCRFQWWNGHCRNPNYLLHQRLPNFGEEEKKKMVLTPSWSFLLDSLCFCSKKPARIPATFTKHRHPCSTDCSWLLGSPAPSPTKLASGEHLMVLLRGPHLNGFAINTRFSKFSVKKLELAQ